MEQNTYEHCLSFYQAKKEERGDITWAALAAKHGFENGEKLRSAFRREMKKRCGTNSAFTQSHTQEIIEGTFNKEYKSDGTIVSEIVSKAFLHEMKDQNFVLKLHGFDPAEWEITSYRSNVWSGYGKKNEDEDKIMFQSKIAVKPKIPQLTKEDIVNIFSSLSREKEDNKWEYKKSINRKKLLVVTISDLHLGRLAEKEICGEEYNLDIASNIFKNSIQGVVNKYQDKANVIQEIVFFFLSDFFNVDNMASSTTKGTQQYNCTHPQVMFKVGCELAVNAIDLLSSIAPVRVPYVESNHDALTGYHLALFLGAWYKNTEHVIIDHQPRTRKYFRFGNTLLGFTHGHNDSKAIPQLMSVEAREDWGQTQYHEFFAGHLHHEVITADKAGTILRRLNSPAGKDLWTCQKGFGSSHNKNQSFLYDFKTGIEEIMYT